MRLPDSALEWRWLAREAVSLSVSVALNSARHGDGRGAKQLQRALGHAKERHAEGLAGYAQGQVLTARDKEGCMDAGVKGDSRRGDSGVLERGEA